MERQTYFPYLFKCKMFDNVSSNKYVWEENQVENFLTLCRLNYNFHIIYENYNISLWDDPSSI